jgi:subtilisin family serine protease
MDSQKRENLLNLALDAGQNERERSLILDVGYEADEKEWTLIIKYSGSLEEIRGIAKRVTELLNGYAVIVIAETLLDRLTEFPQIEYIEKPKRLYFEVMNGKRVSCIDRVQDTRFHLFGQGVFVGLIDSGIDVWREDFRNSDGTTRIRALWDQSLRNEVDGKAPEGYGTGVEYNAEEINRALMDTSPESGRQILLSRDLSGHGTAVAGVAAGSGSVGSLQYRGVAPESELLVVKLGTPAKDGFPRTTELMMGIDYVVRKALEYRRPVAINLSFGNTYGSHDGTSLLERFIDDISGVWKNSICIGTGNEAASAGHTSGQLRDEEEEVIELAVQNRQPSLNVQIWKEYTDFMDISLISPSGIRIGPIPEKLGMQRFTMGETEILLYYGEPSPFSVAQEIFIDMLPANDYMNQGVWKIVLTPREIVSGRYELWLPSEAALNKGTGFLYPKNTTTLTIPSTSWRAISVGAYDGRTFSYADFSGRGPLRGGSGMLLKPDLVAPGVDITTVAAGGGYASFTGTSFATPFVTGAAALLMEWGIVNGNDPYLYGEKVKAYLRRGARPLPGFDVYPNPQVGYGALCVRESLPT